MHGLVFRNWINVGWGLLTTLTITAAAVFGGSGSGAAPAGQPAGGEENWRLGEPVTYENLSVFPVLASHWSDTSAFVTLDEALASGDAVVTEMGSEMIRRTRDGRPSPYAGGGDEVNRLVLVNRGSKPLLLLAGEIVSGGKQDRIIGKDRLVPVGAEPLPLDVFCVEHGRWTSASPKFSAGNVMVHPSVREKAAVDQNQSEVWSAVRSGSTSSSYGDVGSAGAPAPAISRGSVSRTISSAAPTESYKGIYESSPVGASVETFADEVERRFAKATSGLKGERVVGVVVAYGGEVAWSDAFASPQLFDHYWKKLLRSYVVEALARPSTHEHASLDDAREFLNRSGGTERTESQPGVYRWSERTDGRIAEIELQALAPKPLTLHWLKVLRTS
ncbi:MAG: ARPP-1 family domain-containing protein [Candidatus Acidiferrales bacterium]